MDILHLEEPGLIATAVFNREDQVVCRVYSAGKQPVKGRTHLDGLRLEAFRSITGDMIPRLAPFRIGELVFGREGHIDERQVTK